MHERPAREAPSIDPAGTILVHDLERLFDFLEFLEMPQKLGEPASSESRS